MKLWKKLAILLAIPLLAAWLGILWFNHQAKQAWEDYKAEQEAQGVSFDWEDTIPERVPDKENFALSPILDDDDVLDALYPFKTDSDWKRPRDHRGWQASQLHPFEASYLPEGDAFTAFEAHYQEHEATFRSLIEASKLPHCRESMDYQHIHNVDGKLHRKLHKAVIGLAITATYKLSQNEAASAHELVLAHCRIASLLLPRGTMGLLINMGLNTQTVSPIWEGLARRAWNEVQLAELEKHLQSIQLTQHLINCIEQERIFMSKTYPDLLQDTKRRTAIFDLDQPLVTLLVHLTPRVIVYRNLLADTKLKARWLEIVKGTQQRSRVAALKQELIARQTAFFGNAHPNEVLVIDDFPIWIRIIAAVNQAQTYIDLARVGIALERHRLAEGHYPETLDALTPKWLATVPLDRINQEPLRYQIKEDGTIQVYSIGWNNMDDGGVFEKAYNAGDDVWQYTNPDFNKE